MAIYLGSSVGPLLGGLIADQLGYRATFWVTGGLLFLAGALVSALVREHFASPEEDEAANEGRTRARSKPRLWDGLLLVLRTKALLSIFGIRMLMNMAFGIIAPILPLFIQQIAGPEVKVASLTGTIAGLASAASAAAAIVLGRAGDRVGPRRILLVCGILASLLFGLQAWAQSPTQLLVLRVSAGIATGGILASVSSLLAALAPKQRYGAVYGVDTSMMAAANAIAPMLGAALTASWGLSAAFLGAAAMYGLATLVVALTVPGNADARNPAESLDSAN